MSDDAGVSDDVVDVSGRVALLSLVLRENMLRFLIKRPCVIKTGANAFGTTIKRGSPRP